MGRDRGGLERAFGKLFRERQIYHRSEGVVRFIKLSARTQLAMATVLGVALMWVAYASVNVVFKEQIIVSKDQQRRDQEAAYRSRLAVAETALDNVNALNYMYERQFDATISGLKSQHDALKQIVENKATVDRRLEILSDELATSGAPGGRPVSGGNRLMIDPVGREPTPRQSRMSALQADALYAILGEDSRQLVRDDVLSKMRADTADLSARQIILLATLEEDMRRNIREIDQILRHTGVDLSPLVERHRQAAIMAQVDTVPDGEDAEFIGQGGPFIPVDDEFADSSYFRSITRVDASLLEMTTLHAALETIPLSSPVAVRHRVSSGFGWRWDPLLANQRAAHRGLDFAGPTNSPIRATAPGRVSFAGTRGGFGRTVEIDHGNGFKTRFAHLNSIKVRAGQQVDLHDVIGLMGSTGRSTGTHLHYEVHYRGRQVDPLKFLEAGRYVFES